MGSGGAQRRRQTAPHGPRRGGGVRQTLEQSDDRVPRAWTRFFGVGERVKIGAPREVFGENTLLYSARLRLFLIFMLMMIRVEIQ